MIQVTEYEIKPNLFKFFEELENDEIKASLEISRPTPNYVWGATITLSRGDKKAVVSFSWEQFSYKLEALIPILKRELNNKKMGNYVLLV